MQHIEQWLLSTVLVNLCEHISLTLKQNDDILKDIIYDTNGLLDTSGRSSILLLIFCGVVGNCLRGLIGVGGSPLGGLVGVGFGFFGGSIWGATNRGGNVGRTIIWWTTVRV